MNMLHELTKGAPQQELHLRDWNSNAEDEKPDEPDSSTLKAIKEEELRI